MKWIRERDALIAQTLAFVQSVTGKKETRPDEPVAPGPAVDVTAILAMEHVLETGRPRHEPAAEVDAPPPRPFQVSPPRTTGELRNEVQARVANFRKHQERFEREREEYCAATLARARAALRDLPAKPPAGK